MLNSNSKSSNLKRNLHINFEEINKQKINQLLLSFNQCKDSIKSLKKTETASLSSPELIKHRRELDMLIRKKGIQSKKLSELGYNTEKRGRPRKEDSDKYKSTHSRISCYFTVTNAAKLKSLKEEGSIENISAFLNELLEAYFSSEKVGVIDEK